MNSDTPKSDNLPHRPIQFEHHYKERVMEILFPDGFELSTADDLKVLKDGWGEALKKWHSPYSVLFDARNFIVAESQKIPFEKMIQFFSKFFLKKVVGFVDSEVVTLPFEVFVGYDLAAQKIGLAKGAGLTRDLTDMRQRIQIDNDFTNHVMEISFLAETDFVNADDVRILKSKLQNILMQWHTPYSVIFNCLNCTFKDEAKAEFARLEKFLKAFFCKEIIGYAGKQAAENYPFKMYRARHQAAAALSHSGLQSGSAANCSSRKSSV